MEKVHAVMPASRSDNLKQLIRWNEPELGRFAGSWVWDCLHDHAVPDDLLIQAMELTKAEDVGHLEALRRRMHPLDRTDWANTLNVLVAGRPTLIDLPVARILGRDGGMIRLAARGVVQRDHNGHATQVEIAFFHHAAAATDEGSMPQTPVASIWKTARMRMLEQAVAHVDQPILITGMRLDVPEPVIVFANKAVSTTFGKSPVDVGGMDVESLLDLDNVHQAENASLLGSLIQGVEADLDVRCRKADGRSTLFRWHMMPIGESHAGGITMLSVLTPADEGWMAAFSSMLPHLATLLDAVVYTIDPITMGLTQVSRPPAQTTFIPTLVDVLAGLSSTEDAAEIEVAMEQILRLKPGEIHQLEHQLAPGEAAELPADVLYQHVGISKDSEQTSLILGLARVKPTPQSEAAEGRNPALVQALNAEHLAALVRLAAGTVHQVNNKLAAIITANALVMDLIQNPEEGEDVPGLLVEVRDEAKRCGRIISDLFSFLDTDTDSCESSSFEDIATQVRQLTRPDADRHNARLVTHHTADLPRLKMHPLHAKLLLAEVTRLLLAVGASHIDLAARQVEPGLVLLELQCEGSHAGESFGRDAAGVAVTEHPMTEICRSIAVNYGGSLDIQVNESGPMTVLILLPADP